MHRKVKKYYEWICSCGAVHRSEEEPLEPLHCQYCNDGKGPIYAKAAKDEGWMYA